MTRNAWYKAPPKLTWLEYLEQAKFRTEQNYDTLDSGFAINPKADVLVSEIGPKTRYRMWMMQEFLKWLEVEIEKAKNKEKA